MKQRWLFCAIMLCWVMVVRAQVTTVTTGLKRPIGVALKDKVLYVSDLEGDRIVKIDLDKPLPASPTTFLNVKKPTGLLVVGNYLYFNAEHEIDQADFTRTARVNLINPNPVIEQVLKSNLGELGHQGFVLKGNTLYISSVGSNDKEGIHKIALDQPLPQEAVPVLTKVNASGMDIQGDKLFYGYFKDNKVSSIDLKQANPIPTLVAANLKGPDGITLANNYIYISESEGERMVKIDATLLNTVEVVLPVLGGPTLTLFDGVYLYYGEQKKGTVARLNIVILNEETVELGQHNIQLFPNPTTGIVQLANLEAEQVQVFDYTGRMVQQLIPSGNTVNLSGLPVGLYMLHITAQGKSYSARVVME